jgi:putative aldouronate transport system permease protein
MRINTGEKVFNVLNIAAMVAFSVVCLYPFVHVTALSFNEGKDALRGGIYLFPRVPSLENYKSIFQERKIVGSTLVSIYRTIAGTALAVLSNSLFAFALTKQDLPGRRVFAWLALVPMYFSAGIIPYFLVCRTLGLVNTLLVYVIPWICVPFHIMMFRVYFLGMPISLEESATLDGAGYGTVFFRIIFPLATPAVATIALLAGIMHWNDWLDGTIMVYNSRLWPLQTLLLHILQGADIMSFFKSRNLTNVGALARKTQITPESLKMAMLVLTVAPVMMIYPFLQRYFVKGMLIGAVKG